MTPTTTIRDALDDPNLLGTTLAGDTWRAWRILLIAMMGEALTPSERPIFTQLTQRTTEPLQQVEEFAAVVGRRGGKSRAMATLACYIATLCKHHLDPGERGVALLIAPDQKQATIALNYAHATLLASPVLRQLIKRKTSDEIELDNNISIEVRAASFRRLRGPTYIVVIADEAAFWYSDEVSANPDTEILNSVRPGLATTGGPLIIASSPYARRGELWTVYKRDFGANGDPLVLVAQGTSRDFNPSLKQSVVDRALAKDHASASAEFLAQFRTDIENFVPHEVVERCVADHIELPPAPHKYFAFVDPSGGSADSFTLAIAHKEGDQVVIDATREVRPPFSPESTVKDFATVLQTYGVKSVTGDRYAGEWPVNNSASEGSLTRSPTSLRATFTATFYHYSTARIVLPRSDRLTSQICGLERRVSRAGKDSIDHAPGGHDDLANAVAGAADLIHLPGFQGIPAAVGTYTWGPVPDKASPERAAANVEAGSAPCTLKFKPARVGDGFGAGQKWK